ncbi:MAG: hypothetical protein H6772_03640 [Pseudomonadales bacterium]|nr:hypothetical protein [Pseudomonadales bacterium]
MSSKIISSTTQQFLDIFDITNDLVIMKDGTTSLIIAIDAMNFGLLAEEEQDSIMYAYAGLLNSLNYSIQIVIRSQTKDVTGYLQLLKDRENSSRDRNKQIRIQKYREFVSNLIRERNVLDKKFYIVIPAQPVELGILPPSSILPGKGQINITSVDRNLILEKARNILEPKRDHLIAQFARIGLYSRQLETQEIIQLFYLSYNPEASEGQQLGNSLSYTSPLVSAKIEGNLMNDSQVQTVSQDETEGLVVAPNPSLAENIVSMPQANFASAQNGEVSSQNLVNSNISSESSQNPINNQTMTNSSQAPTLATPPAPEIPKMEPGITDNLVPKEVVTTIKAPEESFPNSNADTSNSGTLVTNQNRDNAMPPLAEI